MENDPNDDLNARFFREVALVALLIVAGGFTLAIWKDSDVIAAITCLIAGIALVILGKDEKDPDPHFGTGIVTGLSFFLLWMLVKFLIVA